MTVRHDINQQAPKSGRIIRENNGLINEADILLATSGIRWALANGNAGILLCDIVAEAGQTVGLNVWLDKKSVVSIIDVANGSSPTVRSGLATGDYGEICAASGLNLIESFSDNSQAQVVLNAEHSGPVIGDCSISDSIMSNGTQPFCVLSTNAGSASATISIFVTFYSVDDVPTLTLLESDTALTSTTEISDYGAS